MRRFSTPSATTSRPRLRPRSTTDRTIVASSLLSSSPITNDLSIFISSSGSLRSVDNDE
jgi:hypothetical protein